MNTAPTISRTQLETLITDLSTGIVTLETDGTLRYANRAALALHGAADLEALGKTVAGYVQRFRLEDLTGAPLTPAAYPFARLLKGETFTDLHVKVPVAGDLRVYCCRGVALKDAAGSVDFFALFLDDETERYDAEARFEQTFAANPAPALINRLSDLRFIKVNRGFLEMTGFTREAVIGRTAYEFDVFSGVSNRAEALKKFHAGEAIRALESYLTTSSGGKKFVVVGGQPLEVGDEPCMLLTFVDLDERKRAEDALAQSEERFSKAFALAPVAGVISQAQGGRILNTNEAFKQLTGYSSNEAAGRTTAELGLWKSEGERVVAALLRSKRGYRDLELKLHSKAGDARDVLVSAATLHINEQPCVLWMFHDVTERKRTEAELIEAVDLVLKDSGWLSSTLVRKLLSVRGKEPSSETSAKLARLTVREQQVLGLICQGEPSAAVAQKLGVAGNTVRNYVSSVYKKLGVHSRAELIVWAKRHDVLP